MFLWLFWIFTVTVFYCNCQTTTLTPVDPDIVEGSDLTFVCTVSSAVDYVNWLLPVETTNYYNYTYTSFVTIAMALRNGTCALSPSTSILSNTTKYSYTCNSTVYQVTVKNVQRSQHKDVWFCLSPVESSRPNSTISVKVSVSSVSMTPSSNPVDVKENTAIEFTCQTSASRPDASVTWYKVESGGTSQINQNITSSSNNVDFSVTTSTLRFVPSRQQDDVQIYCKAENTVNTSPIQSARNNINVLYKAEDPVISEGKEYRIIEGKTGKLSCYIEGGNPSATIVWECNNLSSDETVSSNNGTFTKTLTWKAIRGSNILCSCKSQQVGFSDTVANVTVTVLYPPSTPEFKVNEIFINGDISFIVGETKSIRCVTDSNPASSYSWSGPETSSEQTLTFTSVQKTHAGQYTCNVSNTMSPSNKSIQSVYNCSTVNLVVLYPPEVQKIENMSLIEGSKLDYNCSFTDGVPKETYVRWIRNFDNSSWNDTHLVIQSASRRDAGNYICEASNTMHSTGETLSRIGKTQEIFNLEVQYKANITSFTVDDIQKIVEVDEKDKVHFECIVEGIPSPNISLRKNGDRFEPVVSNRVVVILENASCSDAGLYICSALNSHNAGRTSIRHVYLFVRCTPRTRDVVVTERTAEIDHTISFVFNALAYPYPTFTWLKLVKAEWKQLSNGGNILIQSSDLLSNFTIRKVNPTDFTYYKVIIKNEIGINEQTYELLPKENQTSYTKDQIGESTDIAPVIGFSVGASFGCFILIIMTVFLVWRFRFRKAGTNKSKEPVIDRTKVEETADETAFHDVVSAVQDSTVPSTQGGIYYNEESSSNYETLDMENQFVSNYSGLETATSGQTNVEGTYVKMD